MFIRCGYKRQKDFRETFSESQGLVQDIEKFFPTQYCLKKLKFEKNPQNPKSSAEDPTLNLCQVTVYGWLRFILARSMESNESLTMIYNMDSISCVVRLLL